MVRKRSFRNGGLIEQLICIALGAIVLLIMIKGCIGVYNLLTEQLQEVQQINQQQQLEELEKAIF